MTETRVELEVVEKKGLGSRVLSEFGQKGAPESYVHRRFALLVSSGDRYNIRMEDNPNARGSSFLELYFFPEMVSESEARARYDRLE